MKFRQAASFLTLVFGMAGGAAFAQGDVPAEIPPASFTGNQYVDSRGCVYVRAGISGNTVWVPRVNRQRQQICGAQPSLGAQARAPEPPAAPAPAPVIAAPEPAPSAPVAAAPAQTAPAPTTAQTRTTQASPQARPVRSAPAPRQTAAAPAPVVVRPAAQPRRAAPASAAPQRQAACEGGSAVSTRYINSGDGSPVRCGPQGGPIVTVGTGTTVTRPVSVRTPEGYRRAWEDDRLNPHRGPRTAQGDAQMQQIWTNEVPRRLVDARTGLEVTAQALASDAQTTKRAKVKKRVVKKRVVKKQVVKTRTAKAVPQQRLSAMNAPAQRKPAQTAQKASHRYVQVGTFGVEENALRTARKLKATGLPVRLGKYTKSGKKYTIVLAGPFGSQSQMDLGLNTARKAGFKDAFLRK